MSAAQTPTPVDYASGTPPEWAEGVKQLRLEPETSPTAVVGKCPRCHDTLSKDLTVRLSPAPTLSKYLMARVRREPIPSGGSTVSKDLIARVNRKPPSSEDLTVRVVCNCIVSHHGAPPGTVGCGAEGAVTLPGMEATELTPQLRDADIWAEQLAHERLPNARKLAQQWSTTIAAITALFGTGMVINADSAVRSLDSGWAAAYGILVALAVSAAAAAIAIAARAGYGSFVEIPPDMERRLELRGQLFKNTRGSIRGSQILTVVAILLLIASFAVRWYAPVHPAAAPPVGQARTSV